MAFIISSRTVRELDPGFVGRFTRRQTKAQCFVIIYSHTGFSLNIIADMLSPLINCCCSSLGGFIGVIQLPIISDLHACFCLRLSPGVTSQIEPPPLASLGSPETCQYQLHTLIKVQRRASHDTHLRTLSWLLLCLQGIFNFSVMNTCVCVCATGGTVLATLC